MLHPDELLASSASQDRTYSSSIGQLCCLQDPPRGSSESSTQSHHTNVYRGTTAAVRGEILGTSEHLWEPTAALEAYEPEVPKQPPSGTDQSRAAPESGSPAAAISTDTPLHPAAPGNPITPVDAVVPVG